MAEKTKKASVLTDIITAVSVGASLGIIGGYAAYTGLRKQCESHGLFRTSVIKYVQESRKTNEIERALLLITVDELMENAHAIGHMIADPIGAMADILAGQRIHQMETQKAGDLEVN